MIGFSTQTSLFIVYINDLVDYSEFNSEIFLYADDTKIYKFISDDADVLKLQEDLNKIVEWINIWLLKLNVNKCKVVSYGRKISVENKYHIDGVALDRTDNIKDLGVTFDSKLNFKKHIQEKIAKANSIIGIIKRNFKNMTLDAHVALYKSLVRSHLEYAEAVWSPYKKEDIENIEKVQMRATKMFFGNKHMSYEQRLRKLKLPTLKFRRIRGDIIETYKFVHGIYDKSFPLDFALQSGTRGNIFKLSTEHIRYDLRKYSFCHRIVGVWNSLPQHVVTAPSVDSFKNRLDKFWMHQNVMYDWTVDLSGTGSRSCIM